MDKARLKPEVVDLLLDALVEGMGEGFIVYDEDDRLLFWNESFMDFWGFPKGFPRAGLPMYEMLLFLARQGEYGPGDPETLARARQETIHLNRKGRPETVESTHGRTLRIRRYSKPGFGHVTVQADITEIVNQELLFRELLDRSPVGLAVVSSRLNKRVFVNQAMVDLFAADSPQHLMETDIRDTWVDETLLETSRQAQDAGQDLVDLEAQRRRLDGREIWVSLNSRLGTFGNEPARMVWHHDITAQKAAERELRELNERLEAEVTARTAELEREKENAERANAAKSRFLACMSHELRTPLNAIMGFAELVELGIEGDFKPADSKEYLSNIRKASTHLLDLINDILDLARIEKGHLTTSQDMIDPREVIEEIRAAHDLPSRRRKISLEIDPANMPAEILFDRCHFMRVLSNLMSNAIKFSPERGHVRVGARTAGDKVIFAVSDQGPGIPESDLIHLTEPFTQARDSHQITHDGLGLGLYIANSLCEINGARLELQSEYGNGTTAQVTVPRPE